MNLRLAAGHAPYVSELCRRLAINRTQFNRCLTGAAHPAPFLLNRLCDHFGVDAAEFHLPPAQFARLIALRRRTPPPAAPFLPVVDALRAASLPALRQYVGYWRVIPNPVDRDRSAGFGIPLACPQSPGAASGGLATPDGRRAAFAASALRAVSRGPRDLVSLMSR